LEGLNGALRAVRGRLRPSGWIVRQGAAMDTVRPIITIDASGGEPCALVVRHAPITGSCLSLADLGLYVRCLWLHDVCGDLGDVDWFIQELDMPAEETRAGLLRLVRAGYLSVPDPEHVEARTAGGQARGIRAALDQARDLLSEDELAVVARFADLTEECAARAARAHALLTSYELEGCWAPGS
jgi:hypothetical protein